MYLPFNFVIFNLVWPNLNQVTLVMKEAFYRVSFVTHYNSSANNLGSKHCDYRSLALDCPSN